MHDGRSPNPSRSSPQLPPFPPLSPPSVPSLPALPPPSLPSPAPLPRSSPLFPPCALWTAAALLEAGGAGGARPAQGGAAQGGAALVVRGGAVGITSLHLLAGLHEVLHEVLTPTPTALHPSAPTPTALPCRSQPRLLPGRDRGMGSGGMGGGVWVGWGAAGVSPLHFLTSLPLYPRTTPHASPLQALSHPCDEAVLQVSLSLCSLSAAPDELRGCPGQGAHLLTSLPPHNPTQPHTPLPARSQGAHVLLAVLREVLRVHSSAPTPTALQVSALPSLPFLLPQLHAPSPCCIVMLRSRQSPARSDLPSPLPPHNSTRLSPAS
ncbi:unnamed protein product [Closterium sp. Naga37s-1]|nr:unnamed protein product [Closterium sp. Naga37s-1]